MDIRLTKVEIWRILDAIIAYKKDYEVSSAVSKTINNLEKAKESDEGSRIMKYKFIDKNFYYECADGWIPILESLFYTIDKHLQHQEQIRKPVDFKITQIKEKFGCLRVYYDGGDDYIYGAVRMAENISSKICERCANKGEIRKGSWLKVLCNECQKKRDN